jgi:uncharacterized protein (TIGR03437 family)
MDAQVEYAGLAPGFAGLFQVNVVIPAAVAPGDAVPVVLMITEPDGRVRTSNTVTIAVESAP